VRIDSVDETSITADGKVRFEFRLDQNLGEMEIQLLDSYPTPPELDITLESGMWTLSMWVPAESAESALRWLKTSSVLEEVQRDALGLEDRRRELDQLAEDIFPRGQAAGASSFMQR
jgi:hypothetical protein